MTIYRCQRHNKIWFDKEKAFEWVENYWSPGRDSLGYITKNYTIRFTDKEDRRIYYIKYELCNSKSEHITWVDTQCTVSWIEVEE